MIKMIATDMDGTFLRDNKDYDVQRFREQLAFMQQHDIRFVAASGNPYRQLARYFDPVRADFAIDFVADNGARIYQHDTMIYDAPITNDQLAKVITWNATNPASIDNMIILSGLKGTYVSNHATGATLAEVKHFYTPLYQVEKLLEIDDIIFKITFVWPSKQVSPYVASLRSMFSDELHATGSGFGSVDILARGVNKATGLQVLQREYGIDKSEIVAFGDNENDLEMLQYVGQGILMPNAYDEMQPKIPLKALTDNNHDGVLATIDSLLENL
ncbi:Cof-type HAD-IIB family hydrolase [Periweissella ghanensis]|uniref:Sugar phosphatase YbiV n=1 Tax=Periweissella ghanensis TaxID=467997 RepID=A0ABM8ZD76_9LACO|nr:Cof-type HAD-IIB family hydrolase [Periweissella ghanensis]MCM0601537.1 HAD family hydrolase [Periweissella ghanensis]CAH0418613.1 Sugar phosphatase YbiV [Periweissella ghanensis]